MSNVLGDHVAFLDMLFKRLGEHGIDVSGYKMDHVCYRVATLERYLAMKELLASVGTNLGEHLISGRPISTFKLASPLEYHARKIWLVELPAPKEGSTYLEGLEHAEFVIDEPFDSFMRRYPELAYDKKGMVKTINPELGVKFIGCAVKFHHHPLEKVIEMEREAGMG